MMKEIKEMFVLIMVGMIMIMLCVIGLAVKSDALSADYNRVDYMALMQQAVVDGDYVAGHCAELARNEKILANKLTYKIITYEDLSYLSKIMQAEAGSNWLPDEWKMSVGEVVLNRVESPEFPDTIKDVVYQPGQYYGHDNTYFKTLCPSLRCVQLATRLLNGERVLNDKTVVFQANFPQGGGTHTKLYDKLLGTTYLCFTSYPELYEKD